MRCLVAGFVFRNAAAISLMRVWFKAVTCLSLQPRPHSRPGSMVSAQTEHRSRPRKRTQRCFLLTKEGQDGVTGSAGLLHPLFTLPSIRGLIKKAKFIKNKPKDCWVSLREEKMRVQSLASSLWCKCTNIYRCTYRCTNTSLLSVKYAAVMKWKDRYQNNIQLFFILNKWSLNIVAACWIKVIMNLHYGG